MGKARLLLPHNRCRYRTLTITHGYSTQMTQVDRHQSRDWLRQYRHHQSEEALRLVGDLRLLHNPSPMRTDCFRRSRIELPCLDLGNLRLHLRFKDLVLGLLQ
jgi:hypothetical protein